MPVLRFTARGAFDRYERSGSRVVFLDGDERDVDEETAAYLLATFPDYFAPVVPPVLRVTTPERPEPTLEPREWRDMRARDLVEAIGLGWFDRELEQIEREASRVTVQRAATDRLASLKG